MLSNFSSNNKSTKTETNVNNHVYMIYRKDIGMEVSK
jgi:hypothetical protein